MIPAREVGLSMTAQRRAGSKAVAVQIELAGLESHLVNYHVAMFMNIGPFVHCCSELGTITNQYFKKYTNRDQTIKH